MCTSHKPLRQWNQVVMRGVGKGPVKEGEKTKAMSTDEALSHKTRTQSRMRITCGYRTGTIAGGPQAERPMMRAASRAGSHAAYAVTCGCRGCVARGQWPGHMETTAHCMHACVTGNVRDIVTWREKVIKKLKYIQRSRGKRGKGREPSRDSCKLF